jgi:hypothetical protein
MPGALSVLPDRLSGPLVKDVVPRIQRALRTSQQVVVVSRGHSATAEWALARALDSGFSAKVAHFGLVAVVLLERGAGGPKAADQIAAPSR